MTAAPQDQAPPIPSPPLEVLLAAGDALPPAYDVDMRPGTDHSEAAVKVLLAEFRERQGIASARFDFAGRGVLPPALAEAVARTGGEEEVAARITTFLRQRDRALVAELRRPEGERAAPPAWLIEREGPVLVVAPHVGPSMAGPFHLALHGRRLVMPVVRYGSPISPSAFPSLRRLPELVRFPERAGLRVVPVPHPLAARYLSTGVRSGKDLVWQPDTTVGRSGASSAVPMPLFGLERRVSPLPFRLAARHGLSVVCVSSRVREDGDGLDVVYEALDPPLDDAEEFFSIVASAVERIVTDNVDQWAQWRFFPNV